MPRAAIVGNLVLDVVAGAPERPGGAVWYCARALSEISARNYDPDISYSPPIGRHQASANGRISGRGNTLYFIRSDIRRSVKWPGLAVEIGGDVARA
jgi:hypothetical protein